MKLREDLLQSPGVILDDGVFFQKNHDRNLTFEKNYMAIRALEHRIYSDHIVRTLPEIHRSHPLKKEWDIRKKSFHKFKKYLQSIQGPCKILEVGCGNGWLSFNLSKLGHDVIGLDVNETELRQGARTFHDQPDLSFVYADIFSFALLSRFDVILLASSLQYFENSKILFSSLFDLLSEHGEIHIIDTPFYEKAELDAAQTRSTAYFDKFKLTGKPFYFHHSLESLNDFSFQVLYNPKSIIRRVWSTFVKNDSPFPWVRIKK
jgi:SAM-dependent methyltransferase